MLFPLFSLIQVTLHNCALHQALSQLEEGLGLRANDVCLVRHHFAIDVSYFPVPVDNEGLCECLHSSICSIRNSIWSRSSFSPRGTVTIGLNPAHSGHVPHQPVCSNDWQNSVCSTPASASALSQDMPLN